MADLILRVTIPENEITEFRTGFLRVKCKPVNSVLTDSEWVEDVLKQFIIKTYRRGKLLLAEDAVTYGDVVST